MQRKLHSLIFTALSLTVIANADSFRPVCRPTPAYINGTTVLPVTGPDSTAVANTTDGVQTVAFSPSVTARTVPNSWATWGQPPNTESPTPRTLATPGSTVTITLAVPSATFGFEVEPNSFGLHPFTATFYNGATPLGTINLLIEGNAGALVSAASDSTQFTSVVVTETDGSYFAIAQLRYGPTVILDSGCPTDTFQLKYFNTNYGSGQITLSNAGSMGLGSASDDSASTLCANVYTFDPNEEMQSCCSCPVTPNGLASLSILDDLVAQNLINNPSSAITVKILFTLKSKQNSGGYCDPTKAGPQNLASGGLAWGTNLRSVTFQGVPPTSVNAVTETPFTKAELSNAELNKLSTYCQFIRILGSGVTGICKSCQSGARGAIGQ